MPFYCTLVEKVVETGHLGRSWLYLPHEKETTGFDGGHCGRRRPGPSTIQYGFDRTIPIQGRSRFC